jgi:hypothetical protein
MITFFFYKKGIGGVQNLYLNLIKELSKRGIPFKLVYFKNTWLTNELDRFGISYKLFDLEEDNAEDINSFVFPDDIIIDTGFGGSLFRFYKINPYFLFWNVYPIALGSKGKTRFRKILLKRIIMNMQRNFGLFFMDDSGVKNIKQVYGIEKNIHYLPVPIEIPSIDNETTLPDITVKNIKKFIPISYIGRAELWKVVPVKKILINLELISAELNKCFCFHIITDNKEEFEKLLDFQPSESIVIEYHTNLFGEKLRKFLFSEILINFAMGSSCLESAAVGVPSIILDFYSFSTTSNLFKCKYRWLFEATNYNLGNLLEHEQEATGHELSEMFKNITSDVYMKDISDKCYTYVKRNHNLEIVTDDFLAYTKLCTNKLKPCLRYSFTYLKYESGFRLIKEIYYFFHKKQIDYYD